MIGISAAERPPAMLKLATVTLSPRWHKPRRGACAYRRPRKGADREEDMSGSVSRFRRTKSTAVGAVAGNGLMDRRALLGRGVVVAGAMSTAPLGALTSAAAEPSTDTPLADAPWSLEPGETIQPYERPSQF